MAKLSRDRESSLLVRARASLIMLCLGLGILAYLIVIDRREWFHIRPGSGSAAAMAHAADTGRPAEDRPQMGTIAR